MNIVGAAENFNFSLSLSVFVFMKVICIQVHKQPSSEGRVTIYVTVQSTMVFEQSLKPMYSGHTSLKDNTCPSVNEVRELCTLSKFTSAKCSP